MPDRGSPQKSLEANPAYGGQAGAVYYASGTPGAWQLGHLEMEGGSRRNKKYKRMLTLVKIAIAVAIGIAVVNPSFTPKADDASCKCAADA